MNLVPKSDAEKLKQIRCAFAGYKAEAQQKQPFGWYCELVHEASGDVIREEFVRSSPLQGPDKVRGFTWRSAPLYKG